MADLLQWGTDVQFNSDALKVLSEVLRVQGDAPGRRQRTPVFHFTISHSMLTL